LGNESWEVNLENPATTSV